MPVWLFWILYALLSRFVVLVVVVPDGLVCTWHFVPQKKTPPAFPGRLLYQALSPSNSSVEFRSSGLSSMRVISLRFSRLSDAIFRIGES